MTFEDQFAEAFAPAVTDINAGYVVIRSGCSCRTGPVARRVAPFVTSA